MLSPFLNSRLTLRFTSQGPALVTTSLYQGQEKRKMRGLEV